MDENGTLDCIDPLAYNGAPIDVHTFNTDSYGYKSAGFAQVSVDQALAQTFATHYDVALKQDYTGTAAPCTTPVHQQCVNCLALFDEAENSGSLACAVPHAAPIHTLIQGRGQGPVPGNLPAVLRQGKAQHARAASPLQSHLSPRPPQGIYPAAPMKPICCPKPHDSRTSHSTSE